MGTDGILSSTNLWQNKEAARTFVGAFRDDMAFSVSTEFKVPTGKRSEHLR
jgi:hypothetical protein